MDRLSELPAIRTATPTVQHEGNLVGRMAVPRLELNAVVFEGTSEETLTRGVGHLKGTASPGDTGNIVLAGHRDTFFRKLRNIREGDEVTITAPEGETKYRVQTTFVVMPDQVEVLSPTRQPTLTLITCYPFSYIGSAPQRFIVRAVREDSEVGPTPVVRTAPRSRKSSRKAAHRRIG